MTKEEKEKLLRIVKTPGRFQVHTVFGTHPADIEWNEEGEWAWNMILHILETLPTYDEVKPVTDDCEDCIEFYNANKKRRLENEK